MKFLIFLVMAIALSALLVISNNQISFSDSDDFLTFKTFYFSWLDKVFGNFGKLTGDFVKLDWRQ